MSFWATSDGKEIGSSSGEFDAGGGEFAPIPANTTVLGLVDEAKWQQYEGTSYISLRWTILQPEAYKNRKIFQKLYVKGDPKAKNSAEKADKAKRMLAAIDTNCGGQLLALTYEPMDPDLMAALTNKPMLAKLMVWSMDAPEGGKREGNWIAAVMPREKGTVSTAPASAPKKPELDDEIPF